MKGVFVVTEISEGRIMVSPYQENIFSSGKSVLSRIEVMNPKHFNVEKGTKVSIGFSKGLENVQGICSLVFPVLCCALGLFLYPKAVSAFGMEYSEIARFVFGTVMFLCAFAVVIKITRCSYTVITPRITGLC